ncbi:MAG: hypothetical protein JXJ04_07855 [Spirochaetales bacterium]|nr:hypothetical protein [Spirochaetales bacterium]
MKSITIHNLDDELETLIREESKKEGKSLNKTIQNLLRKALGLKNRENEVVNEEYQEFYGIWTDEDEKEFNENIADLNKVQPEDWK